MTYDQWKATNPADNYLGPEPDDDDCRDEYQKPNEDRYEREMEEKLEAMEDRLAEEDPNAECEWESRF
jgi:hypothetical protein